MSSSGQQPNHTSIKYKLKYRLRMEAYFAKGKFAMSDTQTNLRTASDKQAVVAAVSEYLTPIVKQALTDATKTCLTCDHFREPKEICQLYGQRPPARVIAFGCPSYEDEIPF